MNARSLLSDLTRSSKELIQHAVAFTRYKNRDKNGIQWRISLAKRTISILRVVVSILKVPSKKKNIWEESSIAKLERQALLLAVGKSNERSPLVLALFLRSLIASHIHTISPPLEDPQETCLHDITNNFISAYADLMTQISTPQPFPMVQMTRTFLFAYVFTLPFVLAKDITQASALLFITFFITYGFIGLELSNIEMDDPFGDDPNDFNVEAIATNAYRDILVLIHDIDGDEATEKVRKSLSESIKEGVKKTVNQHTQFTRVDEWRGTALGSQIDEIAHEVQIIVNPDSHSQSNETVAQNDDNDDNDTLSSTPSDSFQQSKLMAKLYQGMHSGRSFRDIKGDMHDFENL
jgi:predicted membrane chloride channel (bestrophin family)